MEVNPIFTPKSFQNPRKPLHISRTQSTPAVFLGKGWNLCLMPTFLLSYFLPLYGRKFGNELPNNPQRNNEEKLPIIWLFHK